MYGRFELLHVKDASKGGVIVRQRGAIVLEFSDGLAVAFEFRSISVAEDRDTAPAASAARAFSLLSKSKPRGVITMPSHPTIDGCVVPVLRARLRDLAVFFIAFSFRAR
jgi:hypothetical protein